MSSILEQIEFDLVERLENLLDDFYFDIIESGLKQSTAEKHTANAELFIVQYMAFQYLEGIESITPEKVYDFLSLWYFQKIPFPSVHNHSNLMVSLKRFFSYLEKQKRMDSKQAKALRAVCNERNYFKKHFSEFCSNPSLETRYEEDEYEEPDLETIEKDWIFDDDIFRSFVEIPEEEEIASFQDVIDLMKMYIKEPGPPDNVISLEQWRNGNTKHKRNPLPQEAPLPATIQSLREHCLEIHCMNLIFIRWLDRCDCRIAELPKSLFSFCVKGDTLLTYILSMLEYEKLPKEEIVNVHKMLDVMDRMLWNVRRRITCELGLDLRLLPL